MCKLSSATIILLSLAGCCGVRPEQTVQQGCPPQQNAAVQTQPAYANPIFVPGNDQQCVWEQVVDVVDDYFRVEREEPIRVIGNAATEGVITTVPEISPTIFEPWRYDTVDPEQRWQNTLQTMRRRAVVRVIPAPAQGGYWIDVQVLKDLEDKEQPDKATAGAATFRYDSSFTRVTDPITGRQDTKGWISKGRDASMEQYIIGDLLSRSVQTPSPGPACVQNASAAPQTAR